MNALRFTDVACARGGRLVFARRSFALAAGDAGLVTGPNGAGKSSLLRIAAGLLPPYAGRVDVQGTRAWMGEAHALDPELPLLRALRFWIGAEAPAALAAVGLAALDEVPVRLLSTGQRRRAALARVIGSRAAIWLLDEPANGLDDAALAMLAAEVARHRAGGGIALVASHQPIDLPGALAIALPAAEAVACASER